MNARGEQRGGLQADVAVGRGEFALDLSLRVAPGETVAVLGPNGSGKSTLLGLLAGLLRPDSGRVTLNGAHLTDAAGTLVPPHRRRIGLLEQQSLLFPHLSVRHNVAFGPRTRGCRRRHALRIADAALSRVGAAQLAEARPHELSGGQAARVALARALAPEPDVLLLDEPLAAVDVASAPQLRALLREVLADRMAVVVSHNVLDALVLSQTVLVLSHGSVLERGDTREVLARPRSSFTARLAGLNMLHGEAVDGGILVAGGHRMWGDADGLPRGAPAVAVFSPSAVAVHSGPPEGSPRNALHRSILELEPLGRMVRVHTTDGVSADITPAAVAELGLEPGRRVWLLIKAAEVAIYPTGYPAATPSL